MTKREQIMQAIKARLEAVPGMAGRVHRSREVALSREEAPAYVLVWESETVSGDGVHPFTSKHLSVVVDVYQRAAVPDAAADPYVELAHAALLQDSNLGGLCIDIEERGTELQMDEADLTACFVRMEFVVKYRHERDNLSA